MILTPKQALNIQVRPNTQDQVLVNEVLAMDVYRLPAFEPGDTVLDLGAHIGISSIACLLHGASRVMAIEPCPENFTILTQNIREWPSVLPIHAAVWRSDCPAHHVYFSGYPDKYTGLGTVLDGFTVQGVNKRIKVPCLSLDELLRPLEDVRLLKIDIEGAEYPVLMTSELLGQTVKEIVGEVHNIGKLPKPFLKYRSFNPDVLMDYLRHQGFTDVDVWKSANQTGNPMLAMFRARRKD